MPIVIKPTLAERALSLWARLKARIHPLYGEEPMPDDDLWGVGGRPPGSGEPKPRRNEPGPRAGTAPPLGTSSSAAPSTWGTQPPPGSNTTNVPSGPVSVPRPARQTPLPDETD